MRLDRNPDRSPSPVSSSSDTDDIDDEHEYEAELLESIAEKEVELNHTQELINERNRQVQATLTELQQINSMLKQFETLTSVDKTLTR
ncbi:unnamed protein product [Adineta ricciae]|uniref:Uncharacterized protein n=1 Tax=Adineta ricciae TaxID=249248 RepID=A0A815HMJ6_ADIRI|nr:unnamed protein product [Adineta ricciae]